MTTARDGNYPRINGTNKSAKSASKRMRDVSGNITSNEKLVCFLYLLGRDYISLGAIEDIMLKIGSEKEDIEYSNGWLARYSKDVSSRLRK